MMNMVAAENMVIRMEGA